MLAGTTSKSKQKIAVTTFLVTLALLPALLLAAVFLGSRWQRRARAKKALKTPFPDAWRAILRADFPVYERLGDAEREHLERNIRVFLASVLFEGCGGLEVTDEMRVLIAAQACLLLLNRDAACYPRLRTVLLYPSAYIDRGHRRFGSDEPASGRLGESWSHGSVVLAWDSVRQGAHNMHDGLNVALHEFAHQLDQEDGAGDGAPVLASRGAYTSWARVLSKDYARLQARTAKGRKSVMRAYGATHPAEFFAVATETFFEKPAQLRKRRPALYEELKSYYQVDPESWQ